MPRWTVVGADGRSITYRVVDSDEGRTVERGDVEQPTPMQPEHAARPAEQPSPPRSRARSLTPWIVGGVVAGTLALSAVAVVAVVTRSR